MDKKLSVAFVWHMHQPTYKDCETGEYIMPWVRLHAIKDYLDMLVILEEFPKIKQTFNIVPLLIDQLNDYALNDAHDTHSRLTVTEISKLTEEDRQFILNYFFDANYTNMIEPHKPYRLLYEKRYRQNNVNTSDFTDQEYSDIMAWFNLAWFDPHWIKTIPDLKKLYTKGRNYTHEDRVKIISIQRDIIRQIIPTYKKFLKQGKIEISTSPYYHPILPILVDYNSAKRALPDIQLPASTSGFAEDARNQLISGIKKFKETFGVKPKGIWPSEQCISPEILNMMAELGVKWTITDEGILAKTINKEFIRNFKGLIEDPYDICHSYKYVSGKNSINVLFRNSVLANLIGFEYGNHEPHVAANDLYERIKTMQSTLQASPDKHHLVTIALDGENCWESYKEDGRNFLYELYTLLSEDDTLDVTTVSDYLEKLEFSKELHDIHTGSWINRNFQLWIGDPTKNLAWDYLSKTREDLIKYCSENNCDSEFLKKAWEEIYIAEGSDWFWWYGEPNDSGHDDLFDKLFRTHLQNVYRLINAPIPSYLTIPLEAFIGKPSKNPKGALTPFINGEVNSEEEWANAGCIEIPHGPVYKYDKLFDRIYFGNDKDNIYFRFDINDFNLKQMKSDLHINEIYIYFNVNDYSKHLSHIRVRNKGESVSHLVKYPYSYELEIPICQGKILPPILSEAMESGLWKVNLSNNVNCKYKEVLEISLPFEDLEIEAGKEIHFIIAVSKANVLQEVIPQNKALILKRPESSSLISSAGY